MAGALRSAILKEVGEKEDSLPELSFSSKAVVRTPLLWLLVFDTRGVKAKHFTTEDGTPGRLTESFTYALRRLFSEEADDDQDYTSLGASQEKRVAQLRSVFSAIGSLYCYVPLDPADAVASARALLRIVDPQVKLADKILREMNEYFLNQRGASGDRYRIFRDLDPNHFQVGDREAIKKSTTKQEQPNFGSQYTRDRFRPRKRERDNGARANPSDTQAAHAQEKMEPCRMCGKDFVSGRWLQHRRSGACKK